MTTTTTTESRLSQLRDTYRTLTLAQNIGGIRMHINEFGDLDEYTNMLRTISCPSCSSPYMQMTDTHDWGCSECGMEVPSSKC